MANKPQPPQGGARSVYPNRPSREHKEQGTQQKAPEDMARVLYPSAPRGPVDSGKG